MNKTMNVLLTQGLTGYRSEWCVTLGYG